MPSKAYRVVSVQQLIHAGEGGGRWGTGGLRSNISTLNYYLRALSFFIVFEALNSARSAVQPPS